MGVVVLIMAMEMEAAPVRAQFDKERRKLEGLSWDESIGRSAEWLDDKTVLLVGGVGEANCGAWLAQGMRCLWQQGHHVDYVVNFGAVGAYEESTRVHELGMVLCVNACVKWDFLVPLSGFSMHTAAFEWNPSFPLNNPVVCASGATFSSSESMGRWRLAQQNQNKSYPASQVRVEEIATDSTPRRAAHLPDPDVEDMELYTLAALCEAWRVPLEAIKFVTNWCNAQGAADFEATLPVVLPRATDALVSFLRMKK